MALDLTKQNFVQETEKGVVLVDFCFLVRSEPDAGAR